MTTKWQKRVFARLFNSCVKGNAKAEQINRYGNTLGNTVIFMTCNSFKIYLLIY